MIPPAPFSVPGSEGKFRRVHAVVRRVPEGRVTTYGRVARAVTAAGYPLSARAAGWALRNSPEGVPWHRVVNAEGALSAELSGNCEPGRQRALLAGEGVPFDERGRVRLDRCLFDPADSDAFFFPGGEASP
ncbi:MAG: MGMT family protein [Acidobacteriota bacterium]|nr:MGMT family protein [Acidobacteriota bacterium]